ncbi:hypothetical protein G6O69_27000 [Pseudenhygromyxa sp. WMMC2535]|uniref:PDZ domain-containing protein n=1 Tax=Pseudenhygromyxa sp. WMMC2535 TaxID=2712867 RepID=UPI001595104A|nr:PDZ domain-containing protein [Pseudenhygromyxa sp. WMMC2535]NVB41516.1 hypothetical protein [Pseudenhygromyxa sp. WMMC2535]
MAMRPRPGAKLATRGLTPSMEGARRRSGRRRAVASLGLISATLACRPQPSPGGASDEPSYTAEDPGEAASPEGTSEVEAPPRPEGVIYRSELHRATQDGSPAYLTGALSPEPYRPQGRFEGWVITRLWPQDPELCAPGCDLQPGDIILSVNGSTLQTPEDLSNLLARIDEIESVDVRGIREGEYYERSYPVVADPG